MVRWNHYYGYRARTVNPAASVVAAAIAAVKDRVAWKPGTIFIDHLLTIGPVVAGIGLAKLFHPCADCGSMVTVEVSPARWSIEAGGRRVETRRIGIGQGKCQCGRSFACAAVGDFHEVPGVLVDLGVHRFEGAG